MSKVVITDVILQSEGFAIQSQQDYTRAAVWLRTAKALASKIRTHHKPIKQSIDASKKEALAAENRELKPLLSAIAIIEGKMLGFLNEQRQLAATQATQRQTTSGVAVFQEDPPAAEGTIPRQYWSAIVTDFELLVTAVVLNNPRILQLVRANAGHNWSIDLEILQPNQTLLNSLARRMENDLNIPGVEAHCEDGITSRG